MSSDHRSDGIARSAELVFGKVEQLAGGKLEAIAGSQQAFFEGPRADEGIAIGQHCQTDHRMPMHLFQSVTFGVSQAIGQVTRG